MNGLPLNASLQVSGNPSSVGSCSTINQQPQNAYIRCVDRLPHGSNNSLPCTIETFTSQGVNSQGEQAVDGSVLHAINKHEGKQRKLLLLSNGLLPCLVYTTQPHDIYYSYHAYWFLGLKEYFSVG